MVSVRNEKGEGTGAERGGREGEGRRGKGLLIFKHKPLLILGLRGFGPSFQRGREAGSRSLYLVPCLSVYRRVYLLVKLVISSLVCVLIVLSISLSLR